MHLATFSLFTLIVVALSTCCVSAAIIEIPDELVDRAPVISLDLSELREKRQVKWSGSGSEHGGTVRLDGQKNIFDNGRTRVDGTGSYQLDYAKGSRPNHGVGIGAEVNHNVWRGKGGQSLDVYGGGHRDFNSGPRPNGWGAHGGVRYNF